jgi:flagellar biosynthesis protein FlhB
MAENGGGAEKTEQPTPQRRDKARKEGQVAVSQEVGIAGSLVVLTSAMVLVLPWTASLALRQFQEGFSTPIPRVLEVGEAASVVRAALGRVFALLGPIAGAILVVGTGLGVAQVGFQPNAELIAPKAKRLDPRNWLKRVFSVEILVNLGKNLAKGLGIIALALWSLRDQPIRFHQLLVNPPANLAVRMLEVASTVAFRVTSALVLIALLDLLWTRFRHEQKLMMSKQEVKDDMKETEGNPHVKAAQKRKAAEASRRRLVEDVKSASVVATNPTHYAVALRYWRHQDSSPVVVAKGLDFRARRIKEIAREHGVPVIEDKPLARALHALVKEGDSVPTELFKPVAKLLAIVYRRRGARK